MSMRQRSLADYFTLTHTAPVFGAVSHQTSSAALAPPLLQTSLDFGQRGAGGWRRCARCEMLFSPAVAEDARLHARRCAKRGRPINDGAPPNVPPLPRNAFAERWGFDAFLLNAAETLWAPCFDWRGADLLVMVRDATDLLAAAAATPKTRPSNTPNGTRTFCDVRCVWDANRWERGERRLAKRATRDVRRVGENASEEKRLDAALQHALGTLGRHVIYGQSLCPRTQFSYLAQCAEEEVWKRVQRVLGVKENGESAKLLTHSDAWEMESTISSREETAATK